MSNITNTPLELIDHLIEKEIGKGNGYRYLKKKNDKYYEIFEVSQGSHSSEDRRQITKKTYDRVIALGELKKLYRE